MTFGKSRFDKSIEWELVRYAIALDTIVVGGASKLWTHFVRTYNPKSVLSYADRRYFSGKLYNKLGMRFVAYTAPSYFYFTFTKLPLQSRMKFQKHKLPQLLEHFDPALTEWQNMQLNGYNRIWDCGHSKFVWHAKFEN